jgi:general secretion pathway protein H
MRMSVPGSERVSLAVTRSPRRSHGFTLIELLVVVLIVAIAATTVSLTIRDPAIAQLEREGERLAALLETARAEARSAGLSVRWMPVRESSNGEQFRFIGLPAGMQLPGRWLGETVAVQLPRSGYLQLGPEPMIGAQRVRLFLGEQSLTLGTDGLSPFQILP